MVISLVNLLILLICLGLLLGLKRKNFSFGSRILVGLVLGVCFGLLLKTFPGSGLAAVKGVLDLIGDGYLGLLRMLVIPLIMTSIIHAILNLGTDSTANIKKISFLSCAMLLIMTALASLIGLLVGKLFAVGHGMTLSGLMATPKHEYTGLVDTLLNMLPSNPVAAMVQENTIATVLFAVLLGVAARMLDAADHDKMTTFRQFIASIFAVVKKLAAIVLQLTPYGIFALISVLVLEQGVALLAGMLNFIAAMYVAIVAVILMHLVIVTLSGQNPWQYLKKAYNPLLVAFITRSSFATLPVTEETLRDKFKLRQTTATFVPSIGATIGMNACAGIFPAMLVVMALAILNQPLTLHLILTVMFINAIASLGISGIPGTAYIAATVTLTALNLPYAVVALVQGIDPIIDMGRTATNVNGVMTTATVVDRVVGKA
ncbi:MAG TPA: cation:dicarboxylase symporter family transporter [Gammaproteobacteria bacterium]|nr:cation:dicarboxylase symporter family transporter [Gammaproteobacteria bacterium]